MLIKKLGTETSAVIDVEIPSQGVLVKEIHKDATIKIDFVKDKSNDTNVIPEMPVSQLVSINQKIAIRTRIVKLTAGTGLYESVVFLFATNGVLDLSEDDFYRITIKNKGSELTEFHNIDHTRIGQPILVQKGKVRDTDTEKVERLYNVTELMFPDRLPTKLTHVVDNGIDPVSRRKRTRKVTISPEQIQAFNEEYRINTVNGSGTFSVDTANPVFPVRGLDEVTVHNDTSEGTDLNYFKILTKK